MTIASWMNAFYSEPAKNFRSPDRTTKEAIEHSLKKWEGLLHLEEHGIEQDGCMLVQKGPDNEYQSMLDGPHCSLCHKFYDRTLMNEGCLHCPIAKMKSEQMGCPLADFVCEHEFLMGAESNPKPMIDLLKATLQWQEEQDKASA